MTKKVINSANAPAALGPYSHSILAGNTQFISGQLGIDPASGELKQTVEEQTTQALENLGAILAEASMNYSNIVKTTVFLKDMNDFTAVNKIYASYFTENPPARSCIEVAKLPLDALFEIEAIAAF
jgi:2-iminobutanoate/2-iminopropanoate deaminase